MNAANSVCSVQLPVELSDSELLSATRRLVGRSNQLLANLLAHLAEVEGRGVHRTRACASLYTYCIYELRFSEDEAFRRVTAARLVRRFPALLESVAAGELHLTGLLMLGPHLTDENLPEVLARAKHRTKKEIARLVRQLDPLPHVPPRIEPLGPESSQPVRATASWSQFVSAFNPVRELLPGERPRDWLDPSEPAEPAQPAEPADPTESAELTKSAERTESTPANDDATTAMPDDATGTPPEPAPARLAPERYRVQFEASEEYVGLVERAKSLLSHSAPGADLGELNLRAMRALVAELERKKYAVTARPRASARTENTDGENRAHATPRQRGRHISAAIRRAVFERDAGRCTYLSDCGERCRETARLELHHLEAFARGGEHRLDNVTLRCRAHNALAAEQDFGKHCIESARDSSPHESWSVQDRNGWAPPLEPDE